MPLLRRYYNLAGIFNTPSYPFSTWTVQRNGPLLINMFKPSSLESNDVTPILEEGNMPEEAKWFYVESVRVQTKTDGDNNQNYIKGEGHDDITISPIQTINYQSAFLVTNPHVKGISSSPSNETFETNVNGRIITKRKLDVFSRPSTDEWLTYFDIGLSGINSRLMEQSRTHRFTSYTQSILDKFGSGDFSFIPNNMNNRLAGKERLPENVVFRPPVTINWSFIGRPMTTNNYLESYIGMQNYNWGLNSGMYNTFDFTGIPDNRYPTDIYVSSTINIGTRYSRDIPIFNRHRFQLPSIILPTSTNEEEDYKIMNQNYTKTYRRTRLLNLLFDAAGLINPLTFNATFVRMMINIPNLYIDYLNEQARLNDAQNNFEGFDMPFFYHTATAYSQQLILDSGHTQTITMPTRKLEFMENGEKTYETENRFIELPVNKLFKSVQEFEQFMINSGLPLRTLINRYVYVKLTPYMELDNYNKAYETWARIGSDDIMERSNE